MKRYECTKCQSVHYENGVAFLEHIMYQSKHGIVTGAPPPPVRATPGIVIDDENGNPIVAVSRGPNQPIEPDIDDNQIRELCAPVAEYGEGLLDEHDDYVDPAEVLTLRDQALAEHSVHCWLLCSTACESEIPIDVTRSARARLATLRNLRRS